MKLFRKVIFIGLALVLLTLLVLAHPYFNGKNETLSRYHYFIWGDVIKVTVSNDLDIYKVKIVCQMLKEIQVGPVWCALDYVPNDTNKVVFENGMQVSEIPKEYDIYSLQVQYNGKELGRFGQLFTQYYVSHHFYIDLKTEKGVVIWDGKISGPDSWIPILDCTTGKNVD